MKENKVQFIAVTAMAVALTYVFTAFVNVRLPIAANGGLIHLGNVPLFIMAILFGKKTGSKKVRQHISNRLEWDYLICYLDGQHGPHLHLLL